MSGQMLPVNFTILTETPKWERYVLILAFGIYALWQVNAILHHGAWGQDFGTHINWVSMAQNDPINWFKHYDAGRTNPPLYHFLVALVSRITKNIHFLEVFALFTMVANAAALYLVYQVTRRLITSPVMRISCMIFLLFLPFAMIHAVVLASDGLATPLFLTLLYLFTLLIAPRSRYIFLAILALISLVLTLGIAIKFTFLSLIPASVLAYVVFYRVGYLNKKRALAGIISILLLPAIFGYLEFHDYKKQVKYNFGIAQVWPNPIYSPFMNLRSILMVKAVDKKLLLAPPYNYSEDGSTYELLQNNYYSYPGLLHLAIFTDISNFYQYDPDDGYFGIRQPQAQAHMRSAVRLGLLFSLSMILSVPLMILGAGLRVWRKEKGFWACVALAALFSSAYYLNIVCFFPFITWVYGGGYWSPRFVAPALLCFFMLMFSLGDRVIVRRFPVAAWLCLAVVLLQSSLHLSFLWPWGGGDPLRPGAQHFNTNRLK